MTATPHNPPPHNPPRSRLDEPALTHSRPRGAAVLLGLIGLIVGLHFASRLGLRGPSRLTGEGVRAWADDPVTAIATVARWVSLMLAYYLAVIVAATMLLGNRVRSNRWAWLIPSMTSSIVGLLLGTSAVVVPIVANSRADLPPADSEPAQVGTRHAPLLLREVDNPLILKERAPDRDLRLVWSATWSDDVPPLRDTVWRVESGDSFWSIAEETLRDELPDMDLSESDIAEYWRVLIEANEDRLVDPGNPDLLIPGQRLVLPPTG